MSSGLRSSERARSVSREEAASSLSIERTRSHATTESYLSELLSFSLDRLKKEPELLKQDSQRLKRQLLETSVDQYEAYLSADRCLSTLQESFGRLRQSLADFRDALPDFVSSCSEFEKGSEAARLKWDENKKLLLNRERVATLLEIPKLMETCVRSGNIDEALDLQTYVLRLGVLHSDLAAVQSLVAASARVRDLMLTYLTEKLKSGIQLPDCLSVVGHLRRLAVYTDRDLRSCFLLCREEWIGSLEAELDPAQPFEYLKGLTDIHRLHLFDVVMQYKAVFSTGTEESDGGMLSEWALHRVKLYLDALAASLPKIRDGASLLSLLESSMYCGMSLGRVGLDFRHLLVPLFEPCLLQLFKSKLDEALFVFSTQLETYRWTTPTVKETTEAEPNDAAANGTPDGAPPAALARHLPLALFVNGYLSGLNELRHCAPLRGRERVEQWTHDVLEQVVSKLTRLDASRVLDATQRSVFLSACRDVVSILFPYVVSSLASIYPDTTKAMVIKGAAEPIEALDGYYRR